MKSERAKPSSRARRQLTPILKRFFLGGVFIVVAGFGLLTLFSSNGLLDLFRLKSLYRSLQNENSGLIQQQEDLRAEVDRLKDPRYLEYLARERFGYMRSNEIFILLDTRQDPAIPKPQSSIDN